MHRVGILRVSAVAALLVATGSAGAVSDTRGHSVVGTWKLLSLYEENESGQDVLTCGHKPEGQLILDAAGGFSLQIGSDLLSTTRPRPDPASAAATLVSSHVSMINYRGRYSFDRGRTIHFHVERGLAPADPAAQILIIGDRLELMSSSDQSPTGANFSHMVWQRVR
jgi:lipocalin-like protein